MLVRALLQTSLVLWLAQQTLQGGVKPQSVSWGRVLPARGVAVGVKPGVTGALGALGSRYGSKAMKTGIGRYPGAQLGVGGYRSLGLGGRTGLKQGAYGTQGAYGASLGAGMGLGPGLTNGLGLGLGQAGRRAYGAGLGNLPGYGALAGIGYPGARPGLGLGYPAGQRAEEQIPDLGGPQLAALGRAAEDLKKGKSRHLASFSEKREMTLGLGTPAVKVLDPLITSSGVRSTTPLEKQRKNYGLSSQAHGGSIHNPMLWKRKSTTDHGATLAAGGVRQQLPCKTDGPRNPVSASSLASVEQDQRFPNFPNCGSNSDLSDNSKIDHHELLGSDRTRPFVPQRHLGKEGKNLGPATPQAQRERTHPPPLPQTEDTRGDPAFLPQSQGNRDYLSAAADRQGLRDLGLVAKDTNRLIIHGTVTVENPARTSQGLPRRESYGPVAPRASGAQSLGLGSVARPGAAEGRDADRLYHAERSGKEPKARTIPEQTVRNNQVTRFVGGAGNYLGASLGPGAYGTGLGQGGYLGGAAGKLGAAAALGHGAYPQGVPGKATGEGYGDGATGYLGAMAGNGYGGDAAKALAAGYGNGYGDGYGAGLGYPAELADVAESKAGKSKALSTGGYAGQVQGAYGALGAGLESTGGKYGGGAALVPYGNAPVIPTGLEGEGGYPYAAQPLSLTAEGVKSSSKYGPGPRFGSQQTGYGAQLGVTQDALGEETGKYAGVNGALGNEYKG